MLRALIDLCVRRRFAALGAAAAIAAYGLFAYFHATIEAFPDVTNVQVTVITQMPGLAPEEVERQVTIPLERALNGTPGSIALRSQSLFGLSLVTLTFEDDADGFRARAMVSERLATADLAEGAVARLAPDATPLGEIYQYTLTSDRHTPTELRAEQEWTVTRVLRQVPGVADVVSFGGYLKEFHVLVDPSRLRAHDLTLSDVSQAVARSNQNVGGGFLRAGEQELVIRGVGYLRDPRQIEDVVLRSDQGTPVTVGDVARVVQSHATRRGAVGLGQAPVSDDVEGFVLLRRGENPGVVLDAVHRAVDDLNARVLPRGMRVVPFYDRATLVRQTLSTVHHNLLFGALLVASVVWLFVRSLRASVVVAAVIPLALLTAFIGLRLLHMPANLISMGAIDFGILVDGAVVLVENVLHEAAVARPRSRDEMRGLIERSALDVAAPTFFAMAIIIAALLPVFALERVEGRIFRPLALTYSLALGGALLFALTVVPALSAILLRPAEARLGDPPVLARLRGMHARSLRWLLARKGVAAAGALALLAVTGVVGAGLGSEFLPELDEGDLLVFVEMPPSVSLEAAIPLAAEVRRRILAFPEVEAVLSEQGRPEDGTSPETVNQSETWVLLRPHEAWRPGWDTDHLVEAMRDSLSEMPGLRFNYSQPIRDNVEEAVSGVRGKFVLKIYGPDLDRMRATLDRAIAALRRVPGIVDLGLYRDATVPQLQIVLDRAALARAGVQVRDTESVVETALGGTVATQLWEGERPVPVRVRLPRGERIDPERIGDIAVPAAGDARLPLRELAHIDTGSGRGLIWREGGSRFMALKFNIEGRDMGSVLRDAQAALAREVPAPEGHYFAWAGEFENQQRAMQRLAVVVPLSFLVVFVLLYLSLGYARSAATVLLVAPFAMTGGVFALRAAGINLSVSSAVGFIALLGQVALASLLVVGAIDARREKGDPLDEAVVGGASSRLRVVLMTAALAIFGLTPMALSHGVGSETQRPFAVVIIGGMLTSLVVTMWLLPILCAAFGRRALPTFAAPAGADEPPPREGH